MQQQIKARAVEIFMSNETTYRAKLRLENGTSYSKSLFSAPRGISVGDIVDVTTIDQHMVSISRSKKQAF